MDIDLGRQAEPPVLIEYIRMPDEIVTGRFNAAGKPDQEGNLFITVKDTAFIWGVFTQMLLAGQRGEMTFTNLPDTFLVGGTFTQWDPVADDPFIGSALFTLISTERGAGTLRISGCNSSLADLPAAVGTVVADDASYKPQP